MTLTPEERAKTLMHALIDADDGFEFGLSVLPAISRAIREAENATIRRVLHLVAQREIAKENGMTVEGTHCEAIAKLRHTNEG